MNKTLSSALNRTAVSNRNATFVIAATANSLGCNLDEIAVSSLSICQAEFNIEETSAMKLEECSLMTQS